jgi:uncharacterized protein YdaU (DUF1376 family)
MAKDPAFLFYPGDWLQGTMGMTFEEQGAYLQLLIFQFNKGKFSKSQAKEVLSICSASVFEKVIQKFDTDGTFFWKQRLSDEIERRKKFSESTRNNAKSIKLPKKQDKAYAKHMETETITITETVINKNNKESISKIELFDTLFNDEIFVENLSKTHKGKDLNRALEECFIHHSNAPNPPVSASEWKQKLNTWLINTKPNGTSKNGKQTTRDLATALQERIMQDALKQQPGGGG